MIVLCCLQETKHLTSYLVELKKASAEEMRKSVYANYAAFIRFVSHNVLLHDMHSSCCLLVTLQLVLDFFQDI